MVFPSMFTSVEPGVISQGSIFFVIAFSFVLYYWKRLLALIAVVASISIIFYCSKAHAAMAVPGSCGSSCMATNNSIYNYYGQPYGGNAWYPYANLPFQSLYGPTQYYFPTYGPSPYQPTDCIACMQRYQQFSAPMMFPGQITKND
jgi:hypothetical protein